MVKAFSITDHDFAGVTSCSQQTPLMAAVSYQNASSSSSPVVVEKALTRQLGAERMKKKRKHNYDPGMDTVLANNTCAGRATNVSVITSLYYLNTDYSDTATSLTTAASGEVYPIEPQATVDSNLVQIDTPPQKLTWQAFLIDSWAATCDSTLEPM